MIDNMNGKAVNKILNNKTALLGKSPLMEVIIKQDGEIIYHNKGYAGVFNIVQGKVDFDKEEATLEGDSQVFCFGNPVLVAFAYDQIRVKAGKLIQHGFDTVMRMSSPKMRASYQRILSGSEK